MNSESLTGDEALELYNIPPMFWEPALEDCTPAALEVIQNYLANFTEFNLKGLGLYLQGIAGAGKTTAVVQLAKAGLGRWWGHPTNRSIYFTRASDLRHAIRFHHEFGDSGLIERMINTVKVLIIDDLDALDFADPYVNWKSLVLDRSGSHRPTFITSLMTFEDLKVIQPAWHEQVGLVQFEVPVTGDNRRAAAIKATYDKLHARKG